MSLKLHESLNGTELASHLLDYIHSTLVHSIHGECSKDKWQKSTNQQTENHTLLQQIDGGVSNSTSSCEGIHQCESGENSTSNSKTFSCSSSSVTERVQSISLLTNLFWKSSHLSQSTSIISNRTVRISSQSYTQSTEHTNSSNGDTIYTSLSESSLNHAVSASSIVTEVHASQNGSANNNYRRSTRHHSHTQSLNDNSSTSSDTGTSNHLDRWIHISSKQLGAESNQNSAHQSENVARIQAPCSWVNLVVKYSENDSTSNQNIEASSNHDSLTNSPQETSLQILGVWISSWEWNKTCYSGTYEKGSNNGAQNTSSSQVEWKSYSTCLEHFATQGGSSNYTSHIRLEQVTSHTSNISHIVTNIVGNNSRVSWIIFRNSSLNFSHQISAYISCFGKDTTSYTSKQGNGRSSETESTQCLYIAENEVKDSQYTQSESNNGHSHNGTSVESYMECVFETTNTSCMSSTHIGTSCNGHSDYSSSCRSDCSSEEAHWSWHNNSSLCSLIECVQDSVNDKQQAENNHHKH
mmetsp:Transcript_7661/g.28706  ORF Transcript_7661/g.28706 Transcript_7661/m.28706 type:complete len:524 (-) Transcript_7661:804-2375(-)